jgi:hypothetical protein
MAGSMAPFSAKPKGSHFAGRFVYLPKMQIRKFRGKLTLSNI